jgi:hypothetical protein
MPDPHVDPKLSAPTLMFEMTCPYCASPIRLERFATSCPICSEVLYPNGLGERRAPNRVPLVRDWITALRFSGGDFDKRAARTTMEFAVACVARAIPPTELFQLARDVYYDELARLTDGSGHAISLERRDSIDRVGHGSAAGGMVQTA